MGRGGAPSQDAIHHPASSDLALGHPTELKRGPCSCVARSNTTGHHPLRLLEGEYATRKALTGSGLELPNYSLLNEPSDLLAAVVAPSKPAVTASALFAAYTHHLRKPTLYLLSMKPPSILDQLEEFPLKRAATHPPTVAQLSRRPHAGACLPRITSPGTVDLLEVLYKILLSRVQSDVTFGPEQLLKALREELSKLFPRHESSTPTKQPPQPNSLHPNADVTVVGSNAAFSSSTPSMPSEPNRFQHFAPRSRTYSISSDVSTHDDLHPCY